MPLAVRVFDLAHHLEEGSDRLVTGFPSVEAAREWAVRRIRDSLEELRREGQSREELRSLFFLYGEDAAVEGESSPLGERLDAWLDQPATARERDWRALTP